MLARQCLDEFRPECELRCLTRRTILGYYNNVKRHFQSINDSSIVEMAARSSPLAILKL